MFKRTVIKLSGEAIGASTGEYGYNDPVVNSIVMQIIQVVQAGTQVSVVIGGGNLWRGRAANPLMDRVKADQMGMMATVMNAIYLADAFARHGQKAKVVTPIPIGNITTLYDKDNALEMMSKGVVLINAAGLGHPMFSTDTVTSLRATELEVCAILFAKNVDGVYNDDPRTNPAARKYRTLSYDAAIRQNLQAADLASLYLSRDAGIPSYVFGLNASGSITRACSYPDCGDLNGTYIATDIEEVYYD